MTIEKIKQSNVAYRNDALWIAALVQRLSGVVLACFLPFHLMVLGLALEGHLSLDRFLVWSRHPLVKLSEAGLIFCLAAHLLGGVRILMIEARGWQSHQRILALSGIAAAAGTGIMFLIGV